MSSASVEIAVIERKYIMNNIKIAILFTIFLTMIVLGVSYTTIDSAKMDQKIECLDKIIKVQQETIHQKESYFFVSDEYQKLVDWKLAGREEATNELKKAFCYGTKL